MHPDSPFTTTEGAPSHGGTDCPEGPDTGVPTSRGTDRIDLSESSQPLVEKAMHVDKSKFDEITIDGMRYEHDLVIARGKIRKRKKGPSKERKGPAGAAK